MIEIGLLSNIITMTPSFTENPSDSALEFPAVVDTYMRDLFLLILLILVLCMYFNQNTRVYGRRW